MKTKNILYVEDDKIISKIILERLLKIGYTAKTINTGEFALKMIKKESFDLILMDISLAGKMDGIETTKIINEQSNIPIIYLTTRSDEETLNRVMDTKYYGYLIKPATNEELKVAINLAFHKIDIEKMLAKSEKKYKNIFDNAPEMIFSVAADGIIQDVNKLGEEYLGYTANELIGNSVWKVVHEDDIKEVKKQVTHLFNKDYNKSELEFRKVKKDGSIIHVHENITLIEGTNIEPDMLLILCQDITQSKEANEKLKESENRFATFMDNIPGAIFIKDQGSRFLFANNYLVKHAQVDDIINKTSEEIFSKENALLDNHEDVEVFKSGPIEIIDKGRDIAGNENYYRIIKFPIQRENKPPLIGGIALEITKEKLIEDKLRFNEERLRFALDAANEGTFDRNLENNDFYISSNFKKILDINDENIKIDFETYWNKIVHPNDSEWAQKEIINHIEGNSDSYIIEYRIFKKNNEIGWITERGKVVSRDDNNKALRLMGVVLETTSKKNYEAELKKAKIAADKANKSKSEFLSNMSHEIRTPMNTIYGMTDLMLENETTQEQKEYLNIIQISSEHLLNIINDILDLSRIEAGEIQIYNKEFNIEQTTNEVIESLIPLANKKNLKLNYSFDPKIPDLIIGDSIHLKQILYNLLGNAIKFTDEGYCALDIKIAKHAKQEPFDLSLQFLVSDTGIGIPKKHLKSIFNTFTQANNSRTNDTKGTGLGLSITQKLIERLGGKIKVESTENKGSIFSFKLNFTNIEDKTISEKISLTKKNKTQKEEQLNILIVEDNIRNQKYIVTLLTQMGHKCRVIPDGVNILKSLTLEKFDLIFMDIQMPIMDGIEITKTIRNCKNCSFDINIPIVAVTAFAFEEDKKHFLDKGMNDFIPKPINTGKLKTIIENLQKNKLIGKPN
ncbi:MAG: response regulator [Bacteroidales bacterium]|nr:response regulator [Bacteroidales bacterium]